MPNFDPLVESSFDTTMTILFEHQSINTRKKKPKEGLFTLFLG
jgi:hypothetical protein